MIRTIFAVAAVLALSACTAEENTEAPLVAETTAPTEAVRPTLASSEYDPLLALRGLDPQWTERPFHASSNYDAELGLFRVHHYWRNTSLTFDLADNGSVYMIQVRSGLPGRCDKGPDLGLAFDEFMEDFALGEQAQVMRPKLLDAWRSENGSTEEKFGKVMVRAIGGCPRVLVFKAL